MTVLSRPIRFCKFLDMLIIHYFNDKQKEETWLHTLTFLEGTKMLKKYSKISMFNILKTSLSLKMSNTYTSNDILMMLYHIIILSICLKSLIMFG